MVSTFYRKLITIIKIKTFILKMNHDLIKKTIALKIMMVV